MTLYSEVMLCMKSRDDFFNELCSLYYADVYKYICICVGDRDTACDIVQDTFMTVYKNTGRLLRHENPGGYIFKTAKNIIGSYKRELYKRLINETRIDDAQAYLPDTETDIETELDRAVNEYEYVDEVLESLDEDKRRLYELYYIHKLPMKDIAAKLGIDYAALRMKYVRLRREIRERVKKLAEEKFVT